MKKLISLFLSFVMLFSLTVGLDFSAYADTLTTGKCGENVTYSFDSSTGTLTISGTGDMYDYYTYDRTSAFYSNKDIKIVIIKDGITSIGANAFYKCSSLINVTIPNGVTSIGANAFNECSSLINVTIPDGVKSIGTGTFEECSNLASITIPDSVTSIGPFAFHCCKSLASITIPDGVTSIGSYAFCLCSSLASLAIPDGITSIGESVFACCSSLTNVTIPDSVTSIGVSAFSDCPGLSSIIIPESVTSIGASVFRDCIGLTSVVIPDSVTSIGDSAFYGCAGLMSIAIPDSVTSIGDSVFYGCIGLTSIAIPDSVTSIGRYAFSGCTGLASITIPNSVTSIGSYAFRRCTGLTSITIPDSVTSIGDGAFSGCSSLASITILNPKCKMSDAGIDCGTTIQGFKGSSAIAYAKSNRYSYVEIRCDQYGLQHSYTAQVIKQVTCTSKGATRYTCSRCGNSYDQDIAPLGGEHSYTGIVIKQATCTSKGTTQYNCTRCGDSYESENLDALGHSYTGKVIKQPTCTSKGTTQYICTRCGDSYELENLDALGGHSYTDEVIKQPTCEKAGERKYTCTKCQDTYTEAIEPLGHSTREVQRVEPTLTTDGYYRLECQRAGCGYSNTHLLPQLTLGFNKKVSADLEPASADTYKIVMSKSGYLVFDFAGESESWSVNIYDEDNKKVQTLSPVWKEFYKKSYLQASLGSATPATGQIATLLAGTYYIEVQRVKNSTDDNYSGAYDLSIGYTAASESITETKNDIYYDAPTAKDIRLNRSYNGFLGAKFAAKTYSGKDVIHTDERDAYKIEISKGSGWSQLSLTLSTKAFAPYAPNCTVCIYNAEFELCDEFVPLTVAANEKQNEIAYLYEGVYYIAVINRDLNENDPNQAPVEYTFTTSFKPYGTFSCVNHSYKLVKTQNPTCTVNGYRSYTCKICGASYKETMPAKGHTIVYDEAIAPTCTSSGLTRGSHCSVCGAKVVAQSIVSATSHTCRHVITQATLSKDGSDAWRCTVCGKRGTTTIPQVTSIALKQTAYTYNGKVQKPSVTVKNRKGKALKYGTDYTVSYPKGMKNVGKYTVKVTLKGNYSGSKSMTYNINPKGTSVSKVKAAKKGFKVTWKKQAKQTTGYQVQYSTSSKFKSAKTVTISKNKTTSKSVSKLSAKKKYYVRVRTYKTVKVNGKNVKLYSGWSKAKSVTTKK